MSQSLPEKPNLDFLKREAKRILKALRDGDTRAFPALDENATLGDVQRAIAQDYGFPGWKDLKSFIESRSPLIRRVRPVLRTSDFEATVAHYRDWLGFDCLWEWREAPGQPAIGEFCRDGFTFMVNEAAKDIGPSVLHVDVSNLEALVAEWNSSRPGSVTIQISPPYEFPDTSIIDPDGNVLVFEGKDDVVEARRRDEIRPKMRSYIEAQLSAGNDFPTPEAVRDAVGPPLGAAIEVLNEFPDYGASFDRRHGNDVPDSD